MKSAFPKTAVGLIAAIFALAGAAPASAHARLVESFASAQPSVSKPPHSIKLLFSGKADAHYSTVSLEREDGTALAAHTQARAERRLELPAPPLTSGRYRVRYRVLSTDGHITEGQLDFIVEQDG
jgi:methionine-rich copper-binding protein CopC